MSESTVDDLLSLDFDPDILINLLGKLSLENMPLDVTETLLSLENKTESIMQNGAVSISNSKCEPRFSEFSLSKDSSPASASIKGTKTEVSSTVDLEKESFLSSIGLVPGTRKAGIISKAKSKNSFSHSYVSNGETSNAHYELNNVSGEHLDGTCLRDDEFDIVVKGLFSTFCDKNKFGEQEAFSSGGQSSETFSYPFNELFNHHGKVVDVQLNDFDCSSKVDLTTAILSSSDVATDSNSSSFLEMPECSKEVPCTESIHVSTDKCVSSPDSGYTSCSSAISPCSPPADSSESLSPFDLFEDPEDEDLQSIVAAIVEVENSLRNDASALASSSNHIPVLGDSENPEDHKERILNFLKEPVFLNQSSPKQPEIKDSSSSELQPKNILRKELPCFTTAKKSLTKSKEWKLGYEFKYASKSDLRHSALLSKLKLHSEKNKILKQIQDDERALKRIKVIQLLDKKLKRTAADDRENKRRKIQCKDSC